VRQHPTFIYSENLAKAGLIDEAIRGFMEAKRWNPALTFDPVKKAHQLAAEAKKKLAFFGAKTV
jgi:hypothetical protein